MTTQHCFQKASFTKFQHLKPPHISAHMNKRLVNRVLIDYEAVVNVLPSSILRKIDKSNEDLILTALTMINFVGEITKAEGVLTFELMVGIKILLVAFFIVDSKCQNNALLGQDWICSNLCVLSTFHQVL